MARSRNSAAAAVVTDEHGDVAVAEFAPAKVRRRLSAEDRREEILLKSIKYFATHGFGGNTRDLANDIGVTQPLLFRYFPTKADLIEAVFDEMYSRQRGNEWQVALSDRAVAIEPRLVGFFSKYAERTYTYEWIRLYTFAGLADGALNRRYIRRVTDPALRRICVEVGVAFGLADRAIESVTAEELEIVWLLHGGLFYSAIRKFVYGDEPNRSLAFPIEQGVKQTIESLKAYQGTILGRPGKLKPKSL